MDYKELKLVKSASHFCGITFYKVKGSKLKLTLRGQPTEDSPHTVVRIELDKKWYVDEPYVSAVILHNKKDWDVMIEGDTNVTSVHFYSESKGWLQVDVKDNEFVFGEYTKSINDGRVYKFRNDDIVLNLPTDINKVFAI